MRFTDKIVEMRHLDSREEPDQYPTNDPEEETSMTVEARLGSRFEHGPIKKEEKLGRDNVPRPPLSGAVSQI